MPDGIGIEPIDYTRALDYTSALRARSSMPAPWLLNGRRNGLGIPSLALKESNPGIEDNERSNSIEEHWRAGDLVRAYALAAVLLAVIGIVAQLLADGKTIDLFYHDTYYVLAPLHVTSAGALLLGLFAAISFLYERLTGFALGKALGYVHLGATATSIAVTLIAGLLMASYATVPHPAGELGTLWIALLIAFYAIVPAQILFPINLAWSWWRGRHLQKPQSAHGVRNQCAQN